MLRSQRIVVFSTILILAWLLHVFACDWGYRQRRSTPVLWTIWDA